MTPTTVDVINPNNEKLPGFRFVSLTPWQREGVFARPTVDVELAQPGARGVIGVLGEALDPGRRGECIACGLALVEAIGPIERGEPVALSRRPFFRGGCEAARAGAESVAMSLEILPEGERGTIRVLVRAAFPVVGGER